MDMAVFIKEDTRHELGRRKADGVIEAFQSQIDKEVAMVAKDENIPEGSVRKEADRHWI